MTDGKSFEPQSGQGRIELNPQQLIRWIDTSPDLAYLRDAADRVQGRYDSTTGEITFQKPRVDTVTARNKGLLRQVRVFLWPKPTSIRGKSCASQEFDQSCSNTVNLMSASTLWDAITTYPIIQFALTDFFGGAALPTAIGASLGLTVAGNIAGKESCNRSKGKKNSARTALTIFVALSVARTLLSGVGLDMLINRRGITRGYAEKTVAEQIQKTDAQLKQLSTLQNPILQEFRDACNATEDQLRMMDRSDPRWDSTYRKSRGSFEEQRTMQGKSVDEIVRMYGSISLVPGDCNRQRFQTEIDSREATRLRGLLKTYRMDKDRLNPYRFLSTHFPEVYESKFVEQPNGEVEIKEGGQLVLTSIEQFYGTLFSSRWPALGFSLFGMAISVFLSIGSAWMLRLKSRSSDMRMSYSDQMLDVREDFLNGYSETLEIAQEKRRNKLINGSISNQKED